MVSKLPTLCEAVDNVAATNCTVAATRFRARPDCGQRRIRLLGPCRSWPSLPLENRRLAQQRRVGKSSGLTVGSGPDGPGCSAKKWVAQNQQRKHGYATEIIVNLSLALERQGHF